VRSEGLSLKNYSDSIGNRTRDLPACSAVVTVKCDTENISVTV
jgi:hypothetical protein